MCGFFFCYKKNNTKINKELFLQSSKLLSHRGPDEVKYFFDKNISGTFYRLSIQDISKLGSQPMLSATKKNIIFFNGEIYNYLELKKNLDIKLIGNSDTEVLINLIEKFGTNILCKIKGMFAIIIYNFETNEILLIRDRFGMKPLYYYEDKNFFIASSEIKPIKNFCRSKGLEDHAFGDFFFRGHMHHDKKTFFKDINQLESSTFLRIKNEKKIFGKYWEIKGNIADKNSFKESKNKLKNFFEISMKQHMISDVEIGSFLSGGNDSSTISIYAKKIQKKLKTFTYDFTNYYKFQESETNRAKKFANANNLQNYTQNISFNDVENNIHNIIKTVETPITSIRLVAMHKLYNLAKSKKIKVILEGVGGDELLGGYQYNWLPGYIDNNLKNLNAKKLIYKIFSKKNIKFAGIENLLNYIHCLNSEGNFTSDGSPYLFFNFFKKDFVDYYFKLKTNFENKNLENFTLLQKSQFQEIKNIHMPRTLNYIDKIAMSNSIETRLPYLDHELFEYCFSLSSSLKLKNNIQRFIWKKTFTKYTSQLKKKSIVDPQREWFKKNIFRIFSDDFNSLKVSNTGYFDKKNIEIYLKNYQQSKSLQNSFGLMQIFSSSKFINIFN
jgi:asparagine synthase (glutamine-hydrolysing)